MLPYCRLTVTSWPIRDLQFSSDGKSYTYTAREEDIRKLSVRIPDTDTFTATTMDIRNLSFDLLEIVLSLRMTVFL